MTRGTGRDQIPVMVVRDREGHTADFTLAKLDAAHVRKALAPLIDQESILCSDGAAVYASVARMRGVTHQVVHAHPGQRERQGAFHIQNVNAYHRRLRNWMTGFHGVATRHLPNYLGWLRMLERFQQSIRPEYCIQEAVGRTMQRAFGA